MKEINDVTVCVVDCGLWLPMAFRMAESCKRVLYHNPDRPAFPTLKKGSIGDGFKEIEAVEDFWPYLDEIDLFCYPDIGRAGEQEHLVDIGKLVWGSRSGDKFELDRELFMETVADLGLDVAPYVVIEGLDALREHLKGETDKFIKLSKWRGDFETTHWRDWESDRGWLDWLAVNFGPVKNTIRFLVFDAIETDLEIGVDTYNINGNWPDLMINGIEWKDKSYFGSVTPTDGMPEQMLKVMQAFGPLMGECGYRNQWSMEVRVKDDKSFPIDATQRGGMPSTASQHKLWKNFPEIVYYGAYGFLEQPDPAAKFSIECMITSKTGKDTWDEVVIPEEIEEWTRLSNCCKVEGVYAFPPDEHHSGELGWLCAVGNTPTEVLDKIKELADQLPDGLDADVEALAGVIKEIETAKEAGIPFTEQKIPPPASVLE